MINGSQQSANTTRSTYPAENDVKNQINSFPKIIEKSTGTPSSRKSSYSLHRMYSADMAHQHGVRRCKLVII